MDLNPVTLQPINNGTASSVTAQNAANIAPAVYGTASNPAVQQLGDLNSWIGYHTGLARENSALSQNMAREQMQFQHASNALAMAFNSYEAAKNRDWQTYMSNTSHQREVRDLVAAGLNPVLSANTGASTPSGSAASGVTSSGAMGNVDTSASSAVAGLLGTIVSSETALQQANISAKTAVDTARIQADVQKYVADTAAASSRYAANVGYAGTQYSADSHVRASRATSYLQAFSNYAMNSANIASNARLQAQRLDHDNFMQYQHYDALGLPLGTLFSSLGRALGFSDNYFDYNLNYD